MRLRTQLTSLECDKIVSIMDFLIQQATEPNLAEETLIVHGLAMQQCQMGQSRVILVHHTIRGKKTSRQVAASLTFIPLLP